MKMRVFPSDNNNNSTYNSTYNSNSNSNNNNNLNSSSFLSSINRQDSLTSFRRGAKPIFNASELTFLRKFQKSTKYLWKPRTESISNCRIYQADSLRKEFIETANMRGICLNTKLTNEELTRFRFTIKNLYENQNGMTRKTFIVSLLDNHIFPCKKEAYALSNLIIPQTNNGYISSEDIINASNDIRIHQRRKLIRYIRSLPYHYVDNQS